MDVNQAFEARVTAKLDQHEAAIERLHLQGLGTIVCVALVGVMVALIGKELSK